MAAFLLRFLLPALLILGTLSQAQAAAGVLLGSFETVEEAGAWAASGTTIQRVEEHATDGRFALRVLFPGSQQDTWPGVTYRVVPPQDWTPYAMLCMDVYNPGQDSVTLSLRIDDAAGKSAFATAAAKPGQQTLEFALDGGAINLGAVARIYPYRRLPREESTLFIDNVRLMTQADVLAQIRARHTEIRLVDTTPPPVPTREDQRRGFIVFARSILDLIYPASVPKPYEIGQPIEAFATPGEYEPLSFGIYALEDLTLSVTCPGLRGPNGARLSPEQIDVRSIRCLDKRTTYPATEFIHVPTFLERREQVSIPARQSHRFWLTVHVPDDAQPGLYTGEVILRSKRREHAVPIRFRVLPFRLPDPRGVAFGMYYTGQGVQDEAQLLADLQDMRRHGMNTVGLCFGMDAAGVTYEDGRVQIAWDGTSRFERFIEGYRKLGFTEPLLLLADVAQAVASRGGVTLGSEEYAKRYKAVVRAITEYGKEKGWPEIIWQPVDEPAWQGQEEMDRCLYLLKLLKEAGVRTETDGPGDAFLEDVAGPHTDFWNYNGGFPHAEKINQIHKQGAYVWYYNNDVEGYRPEVMRYGAGFLLWKTGADGIYNWEYRGQGGASLYNDLDSPRTDMVYCYIPEGNETGGPATSWEAFREGVDDYRYIALLKDLIAQARRSGKAAVRREAEQADRLLANLLESIDFRGRLRGTAAWARAERDKSGMKTFEGPMKVPNGWSFDRYDRARWQIAEQILRLRAALGLGHPDEGVASKRAAAPKPSRDPLAAATFRQSATTVQTPSSGARRELTVRPTASAPAIDGDLSDACWASAAVADRFRLNDSGVIASQQTIARVTCDSRYLYLGIECQEDLVERINARVTEDGGNVWEDDCVEIFLDPDADRKSFYQVVVNSRGVKWFAEVGGTQKWQPQIQAAAKLGDRRWFVEVAIPLEDLGSRTAVWGFNIGRERQPEPKELSTWSGLRGSFQQPSEFGSLRFAGSFFAQVDLGTAQWGDNTAQVQIRNDHDAAGTFRVRAYLDGQVAGETAPVRLEAGATEKLALSYRIRKSGEATRLTLRVVDGEEKERAVWECTLTPTPPVEVRPVSDLYYTTDAYLPLEVALRAAAETLAQSRLRVEVLAGNKRVLPIVEVPQLEGSSGWVVLRAAGLGPGAYRVRTTLITGDGQRVDAGTHSFQRIPSPY